jgi:hypothetical protein
VGLPRFCFNNKKLPAQILLQQQKIASKQCDDDNELQPSFPVPATTLKLVHYWRLCCNYYQRAQKWNNAPVWGIMLNDFLCVLIHKIHDSCVFTSSNTSRKELFYNASFPYDSFN